MAKRRKSNGNAQAHGIANMLRGTTVKGHMADHTGPNMETGNSVPYATSVRNPGQQHFISERQDMGLAQVPVADRQRSNSERTTPPSLNINSN